MAVSTFYGSNADAMHMDMLTRLHGEVVSVSGLVRFANQRYDNFDRSVGGVGQNMVLERRINGRVYLLRKHCGRDAYGHVNEATWGSG
ncbi:hypothetical protein GN958_ATG03549 [Phytophthora infestans]|uniref:Uncharacterized protein n=1 Tax=Phytophthora infestans TaxID=4787 RepID=A0A8S9U4R9_PHYIN|nr:hypothetical protein GN958_ATG16406 [Phytophthora infestans]KAF4134398.1 hypothetical protein GN958_ATG16407 [Phytophthora infestans]KAF4134612.1 hypothetical protein GN958_ATG16202 [Phytophthora infestans]KAF4140595.1 hypothetical protein GN958_ATG10225 [Phytophthora infestans]KAF4147257.1 hypothetical protein GN958_ATG03549 [Phytophthora infestans]